MSTIKIPALITKEMLEEYISDDVRINMPDRMYEFALSYMLEDLAEQAEAKQKANEELPEMSEDEDESDDEIEYNVKLMQKMM